MLKVLVVAEQEVGYLEKKSAHQLDSKTANAGSGNFTKYARDLYPKLQGLAWCDMFVDWCMVQAYGKEKAKELLCGGFSAYTPDSASLYKKRGRWGTKPRVGAQIFFKNSQRICHTGIVYKIANGIVYTIEGNTSGASGVIANGGGVCKKSYPVGYSRIAGYGYPNYPEEDGNVQSLCDPVVKKFQKKLNVDYRAHIAEDGEPGPETCKALVSALQKELSVPVTGKANAQTLTALKSIELQNGDTGKLVYILQCILYTKGFTDVGAPDGEFGPNTMKAVKAFQSRYSLVSDGIAGVLTFTKMLDSVG